MRVTTETPFVYLSDRWGNVNEAFLEQNRVTPADLKAVERLKGQMFDEVTFIVRHETTGEYGLIVEAREMPHAESIDPEELALGSFPAGTIVNGKVLDGRTVPSTEDVTAELAAEGLKLKEQWPDLDLWVATGAPVFGDRACLQAFIPEKSALLAHGEEIGQAMLGVEPQGPRP